MTCCACGAAALRPHLTVAHDGGGELIPTTDRYGSAPADLVRCAACGHIQVEHFPSDLELAYEEAEDMTYAEEEEGQRATASATLEAIERHVAPGALCDLGCWLGFFVSEAERRGWQARGVEPSEAASRYARDELGLDVQTASMFEADLPDAAFDAVVMEDVIEHLPDPGRALDLAQRILKPEGALHLALPDAGSKIARSLGARWWSVLPTHVQYFTRGSLGTLLGRHGFQVEAMDTAPKTFTVRYYAERLGGYSPALARAAVRAAGGQAGRHLAPDFRDRMSVIARPSR